MDNNYPITTTEERTSDTRKCLIHFSPAIRPVEVLRRGSDFPIIRLPRGSHSSPVSRFDLFPSQARSLAAALILAAEIVAEWALEE